MKPHTPDSPKKKKPEPTRILKLFEYRLLEHFSEVEFLHDLNEFGRAGWRMVKLDSDVVNDKNGTRNRWLGWLERQIIS